MAPYMLEDDKHAKYVKKMLDTKDLLYYLTEPSRVVTLYWAVNSVRILSDPLFQELRPSALDFVKSCLNSDGGFGGTPGYPSTVTMTFHALQVLFLYNVPYFSSRTVKFLVEHQDSDGAFVMDRFGEKDTRIDCCGILSLHLLGLMRDHISDYPARKITTVTCVESKEESGKVSFHTKELCGKDDFEISENVGYFVEDNEVPIDRRRLTQPVPLSFLEEYGFDHTSFLIHLLRCYNSDGGFGQIEGSESHSAQVFCVLSSLRAIGALEAIEREKIENFLVFRQTPSGGFSGRIGKKEDVCYSFWVLASFKILGSDLGNYEALEKFIMECQGANGGFSDRPNNECDLYHLMFSLASLSLLRAGDYCEVDPGFGM